MLQLLNSSRTNNDSTIYGKLRQYVFDSVSDSPQIVQADTFSEPFNSVQEFDADIQANGRLYTWAGHFKTRHLHFKPEEYGIWRGIHDYLGHWAQYKVSNGLQGHFNMKGEFDCVWSVARDTQDVDIIEGVILETISRNLSTDRVAYPVSTVATRFLAESYLKDVGVVEFCKTIFKGNSNHHSL